MERSAESPADWTMSSDEFGPTPTLNGYSMVLPLDVPNTPNLTWTVTKAVDTVPVRRTGRWPAPAGRFPPSAIAPWCTGETLITPMEISMIDRSGSSHNRTSITRALSDVRTPANGVARTDARPIFSDPPATAGHQTCQTEDAAKQRPAR